MPKTLITDLDRDTSPYNPNRPSYFSMQTKNNPSKRDSRAFEKAQSVITNRSSNRHHNIYKESPHRNRKYTQRGTSKPNPKKIPISRLICDCIEEQPAYCTRLSKRETRVWKPLYATM